MREINAKFRSVCSVCGKTIRPGDLILYDPAVKYSSRHKRCGAAAAAAAPAPALNTPIIKAPQAGKLSDDRAAEILAEIGSTFARPMPTGEPTLRVGQKITIDGVDRQIGTCNRWVGAVTDFSSGESWTISMIDGAVLEHHPGPDGWRTKKINFWTRMIGAPLSMENRGKNSVQLGEVFSKDGLWFLVVSVDKPYHMTEDEAEDLDLFHRGGGWCTSYTVREITEPPAERERREAREAAAAAAAAAKEKARTDFEATFARETEGLVAVELYNDLLSADTTLVADWSEGQHYRNIRAGTSKVTGHKAIIYSHGGYDDDRISMYVDQETAIAAFESRLQRSVTAGTPDTPASAAEWLEKYRGCVGSEYYEWLVCKIPEDEA